MDEGRGIYSVAMFQRQREQTPFRFRLAAKTALC